MLKLIWNDTTSWAIWPLTTVNHNRYSVGSKRIKVFLLVRWESDSHRETKGFSYWRIIRKVLGRPKKTHQTLYSVYLLSRSLTISLIFLLFLLPNVVDQKLHACSVVKSLLSSIFFAKKACVWKLIKLFEKKLFQKYNRWWYLLSMFSKQKKKLFFFEYFSTPFVIIYQTVVSPAFV